MADKFRFFTASAGEEIAPGLNARLIYHDPATEIVWLRLHPGESVPLHKNPVRVIFIVLSGQVLLLTSGEEKIMTGGDGVWIEKEEARGWKNCTEQACVLLVIKQGE
jgi:quercetin dioxygenase-like cupin family protein